MLYKVCSAIHYILDVIAGISFFALMCIDVDREDWLLYVVIFLCVGLVSYLLSRILKDIYLTYSTLTISLLVFEFHYLPKYMNKHEYSIMYRAIEKYDNDVEYFITDMAYSYANYMRSKRRNKKS